MRAHLSVPSLLVCVLLLLGGQAMSRAAGKGKPPPTLAGSEYLTLPGTAWKLLWGDEFDGDQLDPEKWSIGLPWLGDDGTNRHHNSQYASYIMDDDVAVRDGSLHLTTQRRVVKNPFGRSYAYSQGMVTSRGKFYAAYGYFEMRAKLPTDAGPGTWSSFWMLGEGWPPEMDIVEYWGSANRIHQGTLTKAPDGGQRRDSLNLGSVSLSGWHTFGLEWGPGYQIYNIDQRPTKAVYAEYVPDTPHFLLLNSGVETQRSPRPSTRFPNDFEVDYVRVYARPDLPALLNPGFENADMSPWSPWNEAAVVDYGARTGTRSLRLDGGTGGGQASSAGQTVFGLKPNARYLLTGQARTTESAVVRLGVKAPDGEEIRSEAIAGVQYGPVELRFAMGAAATSVTVYCWTEGAGTAFFDDISLTEVDAAEPAK